MVNFIDGIIDKTIERLEVLVKYTRHDRRLKEHKRQLKEWKQMKLERDMRKASNSDESVNTNEVG